MHPEVGFLSFTDSYYLGDRIFITWGRDFLEAGFSAFSSLFGQCSPAYFVLHLGPMWFVLASFGSVLECCQDRLPTFHCFP